MRRITITVPEDLVRSADERAGALDRSRSWIVADALRRYLTEPMKDRVGQEIVPAEGRPVVEAARSSGSNMRAASLGPYRLAQLESDMRLSVEERVKESELAARVTELRTTPLRSERILTFDRYEDFLEWERWEELSR